MSRRPSGAHKQTKTPGKKHGVIQAMSKPCPGHGLASKQSGQKHLLPNQNLVRSCGQEPILHSRFKISASPTGVLPRSACSVRCSLLLCNTATQRSGGPCPAIASRRRRIRQIPFLCLQRSSFVISGQKARRSSDMLVSCYAWTCFGALGKKSPLFYRVMEAAQ